MGDCKRSALLLVDIQPEWYSQSHISKLFPKLPQNVSRLLTACRQMSDMEVIHIRALYSKSNSNIMNEDCSKWIKNFEELNPDKHVQIDGTNSVEPFAKEIDGEKLFLKCTFDAFFGTDLDKYLKSKNIQSILIAGLITSVCVQATACSAFVRGYKVDLVEDCCGDRSMERHKAALMLYDNYMYQVIGSEDVANRSEKSKVVL